MDRVQQLKRCIPIIFTKRQPTTASAYNIFSEKRFAKSIEQNPPTAELKVRKSVDQHLRDNLAEMKRSLPFQRVFIFAKHLPADDLQFEPDFFKDAFADKILDTIEGVVETAIFKDKFTGLFLYMDEYTLLILESNEELIESFIQKLTVYSEKYWQLNCIFHTEQFYGPTFFDAFYIREAGMVHVNETFPSTAANDIKFVSKQHTLVYNNLQRFCLRLAKKLVETMPPLKSKFRPSPSRVSSRASSIWQKKEDEREATKLKHANSGVMIPAGRYNRYVPEVQRMDLILNCDQLYNNLSTSARLHLAYEVDSDSQLWPTQPTLLPLGLFDRTPFDANVTFGNIYTDALMLEPENVLPVGEDHEEEDEIMEKLEPEEEEPQEEVEEEAEAAARESEAISEATVEEETSLSQEQIKEPYYQDFDDEIRRVRKIVVYSRHSMRQSRHSMGSQSRHSMGSQSKHSMGSQSKHSMGSQSRHSMGK